MLNFNQRWLLKVAFMSTILISPTAMAGSAAKVIKIDREKPSYPITKGQVIGAVRDKYPGRILTVKRYEKRGKDCHVVKLFTEDGELMTVDVSCSK